jgi:hypothetical protein
MHRIQGSQSPSEASDGARNGNDGLKSAGSKYSSLRGDTQKGDGTNKSGQTRPSQVHDGGKDEEAADFKREFEI